MYILNMEIKEDRQVEFLSNFGGNILENNATLLNIRIPKIYSSYYKYMDIVKDNKEKTQTVVSVRDEYILSYPLPDTLTGARELTCQLVFKKDAEVFKSNLFTLTFSGSINSTQLIENKNPDTLEFLMENKAEREELIKTDERKLDKNTFYSFRDSQNEVNSSKADKEEVNELLNGKVDKEAGKGLSTNDFSDDLKDKLNSLYSREETESINESLIEGNDEAKGLAHAAHTRIDNLVLYADENFNLIVNSLTDTVYGESPVVIADSAEGGKLEISVPEGVKVTRLGKNILPYPYLNSTKEQAGVKYIDNGDGTITIEGTATGYSDFILYEGAPIVKNGYITFCVGNDYNNMIGVFVLFNNDGNVLTQLNITNNVPRTVINLDEYPDATSWRIYVKRSNNGEVSGTFFPQIEIGEFATGYEKYKGKTQEISGADGKVTGLKSLSPVTTLITNVDGVYIDCRYQRDVNRAFEELKWMIISLGGNV